MRVRSWMGALAVLVAGLVALTGCGPGQGSAGAPTTAAIGSISRSGTAPLHVVHAQGETLAVAPVTIGGKGPFLFIVDTGASRSVVDRGLADRLGLHTSGQHNQVSGVGCSTRSAQASVSSWRVGNVALPKTVVDVLQMAGAGNGSSSRSNGGGLGGLLGSDVLSRFGVVAIDYHDQKLRIGSGAVNLSAKGADTVKVKVVHAQDAVLAVASVQVDGRGPYPFIVDSGAAESVIDTALVKKLHLTVESRGGHASGVACRTSTETVQVTQWKVSGVPLPGGTLTGINLPESRKGKGLDGLLGSDRLSTFGTVALDYVHQRLLLAT